MRRSQITPMPIELDERDLEAYSGRAAAWTQKGDYPRAVADATTAIRFSATAGSAVLCSGGRCSKP